MTRQTSNPQIQLRAEMLKALSTGVLSVSDILAFAAAEIGRDARVLTLGEVLRSAKGVNARVVVRRLEGYGLKNAATLRLREVIDPARLALIADALSGKDREPPTSQWPFENLA